jgi:hypothetical protein
VFIAVSNEKQDKGREREETSWLYAPHRPPAPPLPVSHSLSLSLSVGFGIPKRRAAATVTKFDSIQSGRQMYIWSNICMSKRFTDLVCYQTRICQFSSRLNPPVHGNPEFDSPAASAVRSIFSQLPSSFSHDSRLVPSYPLCSSSRVTRCRELFQM